MSSMLILISVLSFSYVILVESRGLDTTSDSFNFLKGSFWLETDGYKHNPYYVIVTPHHFYGLSRMWFWIIVNIPIAFVVSKGLWDTSKSYNYLRGGHWLYTDGYKHNSSYLLEEMLVSKLQHCANKCLYKRECCAFSYNDELSLCRLADECLFSPGACEAEAGWQIFTRTNVICTLQDFDNTVTGRYRQNFTHAEPLCEHYGGEVATLAQLNQSLANGFDACRCGWIADGIAVYPIATDNYPYGGCGSGPGSIRHCIFRDTFDVWCHFNTSALVTPGPSSLCWPLQI